MTFWKRFRYYMIGVTIGLVVSFFFFRGRGCAWLPENRVKNELVSSIILYSDDIKCQMSCNELTDEDIFKILDDGSVLFSESKPNETPKIYILEGESVKGNKFKMEISIKDSISQILSIGKEVKCDCEDKKEGLKELKMPAGTAKKLVASRPLELNDLALCQKDCYDLSEEDIENMLGKADFLVEESNRRKNPHPELFFMSQGYQIVIEITQETARIINLMKLSNPDCGCY